MADSPAVQFGDHVFSAGELKEILDGVADGITVQDATGRLIYANTAAARTTGFDSPEEFVATAPAAIMAAFEILDESGHPLAQDQLPGRMALAEGQPFERLLRFRVRKTGEERWSVIKARPVRAGDGEIRIVVNIWHDVTDTVTQQQILEDKTVELEQVGAELEQTVEQLQARTEEAEAAQERAEYVAERQRFLAEAGRMLAASLDPEATLSTIVRLAVPRIADWATVTMISDEGTTKQIAVAHADPEKLQFALELQKRYPRSDETTLRIAKTGESELYPEISDEMLERTARDAEHLRILRELHLRSAMIVPLKIRGSVLGTITFISAEPGNPYDHDDLEFAESLAARSALAITNARLYREAQEANRVKSDFLAVMSHELRTPLTAVFGYTELLATEVSGPINAQQKTQLERVRASAAHLLSIIEDILSYARSEAGRDAVRIQQVQLAAVVHEAIELVRISAQQKSLELGTDVPSDCALQTDAGKLRQILVNLLGNAVKFTEQGRIEVRATCTPDQAVIEVSDTGPGIPPEDLARIFEPFQQLERATTRKAGGTGLGLAVTRRFAELLGGSIEVRSELGAGTVFTVRIPTELSFPQ